MNPKILNSIQKIPAKFIGNQFEVTLDTVSIDSRSLQNGPQTLFFALIGANHDAHHYIKDLIAILWLLIFLKVVKQMLIFIL